LVELAAGVIAALIFLERLESLLAVVHPDEIRGIAVERGKRCLAPFVVAVERLVIDRRTWIALTR
jgi:hypothetical protein